MARPADSDPVTLGQTIAVDAGAWFVIQVAAGTVVHLVPERAFGADRSLLRIRAVERAGRLYVRVFRVNRWKGWLPSAGPFPKRRLARRDHAYLERYALEARRAELSHWLAAAPAPLFFVWNPVPLGLAMVLYAVAVNGPCIVALRYNRIRLTRVLARQEAAARARTADGTTGNNMP